ncbi:MAG: MATE family efflux transporter [Deltaproteobacteria bacterium]|nr:MATE family efflux transporter [Deltaproteobacteria bacterium]
MGSKGSVVGVLSAGEDLPLGERIRRILRLALPIIAAMASQNIVNLVDTAMVGQLGSAALGAVGMASMVNWLAASFFNGLGAGVQVIVARRMGEGDERGATKALHGALVLVVLVVLPYSLLLATRGTGIFSLLSSDPKVVEQGVPYLQIRLYAAAFVVANFSFRGYWNGTGRPGVYLRTILVIHISNIVLNYLLIYGKGGFPRLGTTGAGIATAVSAGLGTLIHVSLAWRHARAAGFLRRSGWDGGILRNVLRLSAPTGVQMVFLSAGFVAFYRIAELLGTRELAVTNVLINLSMVCVLPAMGFGLAATTLVGQALGAGNPQAASRWGWSTAGIASAAMLMMGLTLAAFPQLWLGLLMNDPEAEALGVAPLVLLGSMQVVDGVGNVLSQTLIGAGAVRAVMGASVLLQWGVFLPLAYVGGVHLGGGLLALWGAMAIYRVLFAGVMAFVFRRGRWKAIKV